MKFGTKSVLVKGGKVLLIRRSNYDTHMAGKWDFPGGRLEPGELVFAGHKREVFEETKLKIEIVEPVRSWAAERKGEMHAGITFLSIIKEGNLALSSEHTEHKWVLPEEAEKMDIEDWMKNEIRLASEINPSLFAKHSSEPKHL